MVDAWADVLARHRVSTRMPRVAEGRPSNTFERQYGPSHPTPLLTRGAKRKEEEEDAAEGWNV